MAYDVRRVEPCITEDIGNETTDDNLIPKCMITHVYLTLLTGDCEGVVLVSLHACLLVQLSLVCRLVTVSIQMVIQLVPQERIQVHCWFIVDAEVKTDVDSGVSCE